MSNSGTYVWLVKVFKVKSGYHSFGLPFNPYGFDRYRPPVEDVDVLQWSKVFTSKISAINYQVKMSNKGYKVTIEKYYG